MKAEEKKKVRERERERERERDRKSCRSNGAFTHGIHPVNAVLVAEYHPPVSPFCLLPFIPPSNGKSRKRPRVYRLFWNKRRQTARTLAFVDPLYPSESVI